MTTLAQNPALNTPMLRQYMDIKQHHKDAILFFRLGDFYEMFLEDALVASDILNLTLTGRGKDENRVPMCGIPYHAAENYIAKLVENNFKVAICEQVENAAESIGITKREVVKIITPGTVLTQNIIDAQENNFLVACSPGKKGGVGMSFVDITTGEFRVFTAKNKEDCLVYIDQLSSKEVLISPDSTLVFKDTTLVNQLPMLDPKRAEEELCRHFNVKHLTSFGIEHYTESFPAAWAIIDYLKTTQKTAISQLTKCLPYKTDQTLIMDSVTIKNMELFTSSNQQKKGSLFWVLNHTRTAMGGRKLNAFLRSPLCDTQELAHRYDVVGALKEDLLSREEIREIFKCVYDLERLISRIVSDHYNPKDLLALNQSLKALMDLSGVLEHFSVKKMKDYAHFLETFQKKGSALHHIIQTISSAIKEDAPNVIRDGRFIKEGYSTELDALLLTFKDIRQWIANLEPVERDRSGIRQLKVGFNKVFGYYFQISNSFKGPIPEHYIRKQTLSNGERYITPELKEKETVLLNGEEQQRDLEISIYKDIVDMIKSHVSELQALADIVAELDCFQSLATVAQTYNYCRPEFANQDDLVVKFEESRHPVLEKTDPSKVISNTINMSKDANRFVLITGPNMAGKSTLMRQVALCIIMAQIGSFVPAKSAKLSVVDRLFTRIGALDNLYSGQSTFMVEMLETATILHNATPNSFILLDEIGRGTATYDGLSIAGAVSHYIHTKIKARTLFATHYHELISLSKQLPAFQNFSMSIVEENGQLAFTYSFVEGAADKSYGVHVAEMAGLPAEVLEKAKAMMATFESEGTSSTLNAAQLLLF